eukprot:m51a1_g14494 hypothetical protein (247) ;mRNA; r:766319-767059
MVSKLLVVCVVAMGLSAGCWAASNRTVSSTGSGSVSVTPTFATVELGATSTNDTASAALNATSSALSTLRRSLRSSRIPDSDVRLSEVSLTPVFPMDNDTGVMWTSTVLVTITVRDVNTVGEVIDSAVSSGANDINSVTYGVDGSTRNNALQLARSVAVDEAHAVAAQLADLVNATLGLIVSVSDTSFSPSPVIVGSLKNAITLPVGTLTVTDSVSAVWELIVPEGTVRMDALTDDEAALLAGLSR